MKLIEEPQKVRVMEGQWSITDAIRDVVETGTQEDPFYIMDLGEVVEKYRHWKRLMPRVEPFYATKCNDDKVLLQTLAALGAGFDCASRAEIELVTSLGVPPERIIFANPMKMPSHIRASSAANVLMMTFDSVGELHKIKKYMPHAQLLLRFRCDAAVALFRLSLKYGCDPDTEAPGLLKLAADLGLKVIGVAFHAGSIAEELQVYARGLRLSRKLIDTGAALGHRDMYLVDIGGGFPGHKDSSIVEQAEIINATLEECFPTNDVRVVAEPGRYFATSVSTLATMVFAMRDVPSKISHDQKHRMYYINDGIFRSFSCMTHAPSELECEPLYPSNEPPIECSIWGPTADSVDIVVRNKYLPPLSLGDWLVFPFRGAYSVPLETRFNGFPGPSVKHVVDVSVWSDIRKIMPSSVVFELDRKYASKENVVEQSSNQLPVRKPAFEL